MADQSSEQMCFYSLLSFGESYSVYGHNFILSLFLSYLSFSLFPTASHKSTFVLKASWPTKTHCRQIWFFSTETKRWISRVVMFYGYSSCQCSGLDGWSVVLKGTYRRRTPFFWFLLAFIE